MIDEIVIYINNNPIIFALIVILLLFVIYKLYNGYNCTSESFQNAISNSTTNYSATNQMNQNANSANQNVNVTDPNAYVINPALPEAQPIPIFGNVTNPNDLNNALVGDNKYVRFRCKIGGNYYYLMIMPINSCGNFNLGGLSSEEAQIVTNQMNKDCGTNVLVLVDEKTALQQENDYIQDVVDLEKVCNFQQSLACNR